MKKIRQSTMKINFFGAPPKNFRKKDKTKFGKK
jgi:hypothetical protein